MKLELYIDSTSNGEPASAKWEKVGEALDEGKDWSGASGGAAKIDGCKDYNGLENAFDAIAFALAGRCYFYVHIPRALP